MIRRSFPILFFCHLSFPFAYVFSLVSDITFMDLINVLKCTILEKRQNTAFEYLCYQKWATDLSITLVNLIRSYFVKKTVSI